MTVLIYCFAESLRDAKISGAVRHDENPSPTYGLQSTACAVRPAGTVAVITAGGQENGQRNHRGPAREKVGKASRRKVRHIQ